MPDLKPGVEGDDDATMRVMVKSDVETAPGLIREQLPHRHAERQRDANDVPQRRIPARRLDTAQVRSVNPRLFREALLGPALLAA